MTVTLEVGPKDDPDKWLTDMVYFLSHGVPPEELSKAERKRLGVRSRAFGLMNDNLYLKSTNGVSRRVVRKDEQEDVVRECHSGVAGGHYVGEVTVQKVWQSGLWWLTVLQDAYLFAKECDLCQRTGQPQESARMPHQPDLPLEPFQKWGLNFIGPLNPAAAQTGNSIYLLQRIIAQSGWRRRRYGITPCHPPPNFYTSIFGVVTDAPSSW
jgi:hypothetical protein